MEIPSLLMCCLYVETVAKKNNGCRIGDIDKHGHTQFSCICQVLQRNRQK